MFHASSALHKMQILLKSVSLSVQYVSVTQLYL